MDFWASMRVMVRRWYLVVPALVLTVVFTQIVLTGLPPVYQASTSVILLPPPLPIETEKARATSETNPYLGFGTLTVMAQVMATVMDEQRVHDQLKEAGVGASYTVAFQAKDGGFPSPYTPPILTVSANARVPAVALRAVASVAATLGTELSDRQRLAGAPQHSWISAQPIAASSRATLVTGSRIRVMAGMGVLGLALAIGAAFLAEGRGERSAAQRVASRPVIADPPPPLVVRPRVAMTRRPAPNAAAGRTRA